MKLTPHDNIGELITMGKFIDSCHSHCFTDYDGCGYYATHEMQSDIRVYPSQVFQSGKIDTSWNYVKWYNR